MYSPLSKTLKDYKEGKTEHWETHDKILRLFNDVGQSEQFCACDAPLIRTSDKGSEYCGLCEKDLD